MDTARIQNVNTTSQINFSQSPRLSKLCIYIHSFIWNFRLGRRSLGLSNKCQVLMKHSNASHHLQPQFLKFPSNPLTCSRNIGGLLQ